MTLPHPHLGESRRQELRNSPFWPTPLFKSQLVKDGEDFLLKKGTSKNTQGFAPYQNKPFRGPHHNKKRGSYRKHPYGGNSSQSSNQSFSSTRVNTQAVVDLTQSLGWIINQEKSELKPTQVFSFMGYEYHLD